MTDEPAPAADVSDIEVRPAASQEYELAAVATATIEGPAGEVHIRRRYEALPRHNDAVDSDTMNSNDELVNSSDMIHVHTRYYMGDEAEDYVLDSHDTWTPELSVLEEPAAFLAACHDHHIGDAGRAYAEAAAERDRPDRR